MVKTLTLYQLLGSSTCEDEKGKRCKAFAVPATVSTATLNTSTTVRLGVWEGLLSSTSQETCLGDSCCACSG